MGFARAAYRWLKDGSLQVDNIIVFESDQGPLAAWDDHIRSTCEALDKIIDVVHSKAAAAL
jgi:hypothetical protein